MRCYITLLACGWLLLSPPLKQAGWRQVKAWLGYAVPAELDTKAPYSTWKIIKSFDSAADCEAELSNGRRIASDIWVAGGKRLSDAILQGKKDLTAIAQRAYDEEQVNYQNASSSVCLPSDAAKLQ